jgi:16S rRNA (guanine(966)-N(2))-methyltransferase RsmD
MRIIAGEFRGRRIEAPAGESTRPMLDRVREALFSTVQDWMDGARVLDLFAGSGSLGLEALSRGAERARFVERSTPALAILRRNVQVLGVEDRARIVRGNALQPATWTETLASDRAARSEPDGAARADAERDAEADIVFLDPPYAMLDDPMDRQELLATVDRLMREGVAAHGVLVFHAPTRALERLRFDPRYRRDDRAYGSSTLCYLFQQRNAAEKNA